MSGTPTFTINYYGVTGTFCAPLLPRKVREKIVRTIRLLVEKDRLADLKPGPELDETICRLLDTEVPFSMRSTYGGNTTCVQVVTADEMFIIDCGSGMRELGIVLDRQWKAEGDAARRRAHVLLTHAHIDHTFATPYFSSYYNKKNAFTVWGPQVVLDSLTAVLDPKSVLSQVYFPPTYSEMKGIESFRRIEPGADVMIGKTRITTHALNHPGGSMAYRLENSGKIFVFATDHEHPEVPDRGLVEFARGADLLYTEGQYTQTEYLGEVGIATDSPLARRGWGHSTIEACVTTALEAGVKRLHIGHRDPRRNDERMATLEEYLKKVMRDEIQRLKRPADACEALVPFEGMEVRI